MSKTLIIAEKPSVAREIAPLVGAKNRRNGYLEGATHIVSWAVGHLVGIAEPEEQDAAWAGRWTIEQLPMLPPKFALRVLPQTADQFATLQQLLGRDDVSSVVNATDAGREGELIFRRIYLVAGCSKPVQRLWASDMTEEGLTRSLANLLPDAEKRNLGLASFARAEADWLVGMNYSRLFTIKMGGLVSVGRVQTPVLCLLTERKNEIEHFTPQDFWTVEAVFSPATSRTQKTEASSQDTEEPLQFRGVWHRPPEQKETRVEDEHEAATIASACTGKQGTVHSVQSRAGSQQAPLPFDLTTLQREANIRFGYSAKDTLSYAQSLYETRKLITYPRTDSRHITKELFSEILHHLRAVHPLFPEETMLAVSAIKATQGKKTQKKTFACVDDTKVTDHHAIIPTARRASLQTLSKEENAIYEMICRRTLAAFCPAAQFATSSITIMVDDHPFIARGKVFKNKGWLVVEPWRTAEDSPLPPLKKGNNVHTHSIESVKRQTKAPAHFTDASLLAAMETAGKLVEDDALRLAMKERGLGTPATRAQIIETLIARGYVAKQGKKLIATDLGMRTAETIRTLLPEVASPELTGQWEKRLKDIENGSDSYPQFMRSIRESVWKGVHAIRDRNITQLLRSIAKRYTRTADGKCPLCGSEVISTPRGYSCSAQGSKTSTGCPFILWKTMHNTEIDEATARELLKTGITSQALEFTSRQGKQFKAKLILEGGRVELSFVRETPFSSDANNPSTGNNSLRYDDREELESPYATNKTSQSAQKNTSQSKKGKEKQSTPQTESQKRTLKKTTSTVYADAAQTDHHIALQDEKQNEETDALPEPAFPDARFYTPQDENM